MLTTILKDVDFIKENMRDQKDLNKDILITMKGLQESQKINTDFILSSLKQDAIIKREEIIKSVKEVKEMVVKNEHEYQSKNALLLERIESITADLEHLKKIKENTYHEDTETKECGPSVSFYQDTREDPPHITNKTPLYNDTYMQEEVKRNNSADSNRDSTPYRSMDMSAINKLMPPIKDWPKFSGEGEYDHITFIKYIDHMLKSYRADEEAALSRMPRLFEGVAADWFVTKSEAVGQQPWSVWKELIKAQFGTRIWQTAKREAFETDYFDPTKDVAASWCLRQKKRLDCIYSNLTLTEINDRILSQCKGSLQHLMRCRIHDMNVDLTTFIGVLEEIVILNGLNKKITRLSPTYERKDITKNEATTKDKIPDKPSFNSAPVRRNAIPECWNCHEKGHRSLDCPQPKKKINNIEVQSNSERSEEESSSQFDETEEPSLDFQVIQADIGDDFSINSIHGESNLPQTWNSSMEVGHISDAKLLSNKPEQGMSYLTGKTCYTTVLFNNQALKALLDIGAFCSCTSEKFLDKCYPQWRNNLLPVPKAKFSSCNSSMKPLGVITMALIFPHSKGSLCLTIEFVVLQDALCDYLILGMIPFVSMV